MEVEFGFFFNSIMLGIGLAMDAFSVSLANGLNEPHMKIQKMAGIAGIFSAFQGMMPMIGWLCVHTIVRFFRAFEGLIPWIAMALLCWIGSKMIYDSVMKKENADVYAVGFKALLVQGVATSIDALSAGFTIAEYDFLLALFAVLMIAAVTFVICFAGITIGKKAGSKLAGKAGILGGVILVFIGIRIFCTGSI